jgi:sorbitol-specific phosphotransferase system component IIBC
MTATRRLKMADLTTTTHVVGAIGSAVVGATAFAIAAPVLVPVLGLGAIGAAIVGFPVIGTALGAWAGWHIFAPAPATVQQLVRMN